MLYYYITHQFLVANLLLIKHAMELKVTIESHHTNNAFYDFKITNCVVIFFVRLRFYAIYQCKNP